MHSIEWVPFMEIVFQSYCLGYFFPRRIWFFLLLLLLLTTLFAGVVVGVSDFLMTTLAKGTVMVGKKIGTAISESDVSPYFSVKTVHFINSPHIIYFSFRWLRKER